MLQNRILRLSRFRSFGTVRKKPLKPATKIRGFYCFFLEKINGNKFELSRDLNKKWVFLR
jgi:hypothetical protein